MYIEQIYTNCLAEAAYYIESDDVAAVIDPMRDVEPFMALSRKRGVQIKYIFETHFHADFVSGHLDLAAKTGATIIYGPNAAAEFNFYLASDGEEFRLGDITLKLLHTPGHTLESSCILLLNEQGIPHSVFTGDTLFVGDVGRPDLAVNDSVTKEDLAGMLYDSIQNKLLVLPGYVIVYPGHGAGSACGKNIGTESHSTIGVEKKNNYSLRATSKTEFVKMVTDGLSSPPKYFFMDAGINKKGYDLLETVIEKNCIPVSLETFKKNHEGGRYITLDVRPGKEFANEFIPGSTHIGLEGSFASMAGTILDPEKPLLLVSEKGKEHEAVLRLARIGFENVAGYLEGGIRTWKAAGYKLDSIESVSAEKFVDRFQYNSCVVLDVRNPAEWVPGFVAGAKLLALPQLEEKTDQIPRDKTCFVYCAGGYRSMTAASILKKHGFTDVVNIEGGMNKLKKTTINIKQLSAIPQ